MSLRAALIHRLVPVLVMLPASFGPATALAQQAPAPASQGADPFGRKYPARVYTTVRLVGPPPAIDGRLDDEAWKQGEWGGSFTQQAPTEGVAPSQPTELKILYDDQSLYFAIRAYDDPRLVHRYPGRRDDFNEYAVDVVGICFDSYNDKRYGFEFDLTAGGGKIDLVLGNGETEWDTTWDAVWDGKVAHDEGGWTAEFRVPFSQLRYGPQDEQVWGMHAWRWIARNQEEDQWQLIPRQNTGRMYQLGELRGLRGLPRSRDVEMLPHVLGKVTSGPSAPSGTTAGGGAGFDAKMRVASNFTIDGTVNPDFGQVEADPSVMNLTAYETFYQEKRSFFLEGRKILTFDLEDEDQLFYSRRIGEAPSFSPAALAGETASFPESTTILGAFKVSGKANNGVSVAALQAVTQKEMAHFESALGTRSLAVEPAGSYSVGRLQKDWDKGNTSLGTMVTSTHRAVSDPSLNFLATQATTGGVDFTRNFANRAWLLEARGAFSRVSGDVAAIRALQRNPVHYYQRTDATHLGVDANATSLAGHAGSVLFGRSGGSRLHLTEHVRWYSPGFDVNDVGYLRQADLISNGVYIGWSEPAPRGAFRNYSVNFAREDNWDFGGLHTAGRTEAEASAQFANKWTASGRFEYEQEVDTRALRGGPALRLSDVYSASAHVGTDSARRAALSLSASRDKAVQSGASGWHANSRLRLRPSNAIWLSANLGFERRAQDLQYVTTVNTTDGPRWLLGRIDQKTWSVTFRANVTLTPELTVQYYGSPFIATGRYSGFRTAAHPTAANYEDRFHRYADSEIAFAAPANGYQVAESAGASYSFANPDFSFEQFRSNLVLRWEYKPGSPLYVVWSQGRTGFGATWYDRFRTNWSELWRAPADNILLVKMSYWFSL